MNREAMTSITTSSMSAKVMRSVGPWPNGLPISFSRSFAACSSSGWFSGE
jgi:hypothetical protein